MRTQVCLFLLPSSSLFTSTNTPLLEDTATIHKAMHQVNHHLAGKADGQSVNQATRWVMTKEEHANKVERGLQICSLGV